MAKDAMTDKSPITLCGSLSKHPVGLGAALHRAGYEALGLPFTYVPFAVDDLEGALRGMRALGIRGLGVSMPYKIEVMKWLDRVEDQAARIGAVNTIVNDGGVLTGHNTDAWGAARALGEAMELRNKRVIVVGAGGAARAVAHALCDEGARLYVVNRTPEKAAQLVHELRRSVLAKANSDLAPVSGVPMNATAGALAELTELGGFAALVNCTSAGMLEHGGASPVPTRFLRADLVVMDIVYKPVETELVKAAREIGARVVDGRRMLLHQACRQFELYTGAPAPVEAMNAAVEQALG
jgi:shikimate dehydrogenase